jgi:type II secretion system protein H
VKREGTSDRRAARAGFSMIEMLGVLLILGLIATLVTVNWRAILPKAELHSAVRTLANRLQSTRSEAIARNAEYRIEYDLDRHRYRVNTPFKADQGLALREEDRVSLPWDELPSTVRFAKVQIDGVDYVGGLVRVRFDPLGSANGHVITFVQKPEDNFYTVEVQGLTGLIDYHEGLWARTQPREEDFD